MNHEAPPEIRLLDLLCGWGVAAELFDGKVVVPRADIGVCARQLLENNVLIELLDGCLFDGHRIGKIDADECYLAEYLQPSYEKVSAFLEHIPDEVTHFIVVARPVKAATRESWGIGSSGEQWDHVAYARRFLPEEFGRIVHGFIPTDMDDKWFIYFEENMLHFHRSWTGKFFASVRFVERQGYHEAQGAILNVEGLFHDPDSPAETVRLIDNLIDVCLLGKEWRNE